LHTYQIATVKVGKGINSCLLYQQRGRLIVTPTKSPYNWRRAL